MSVHIRAGTPADALLISEFVCGLSREFITPDFPAAAQASFLRDHTQDRVGERLAGDFRFYVAEDDGRMAAVAAIRSNSHLYYLFVGKQHQRAGLARQLLARVMEESVALGNPGSFTVNASNYAVPAYEKLGFRRTGPTVNSGDVLYNPMQLVIATR